jgi:hypothetical protein
VKVIVHAVEVDSTDATGVGVKVTVEGADVGDIVPSVRVGVDVAGEPLGVFAGV